MRAVSLCALVFAVSSGWALPAAAQMPGISEAQATSRSPLLGGVPSGTPTDGVLTLTLLDAMSRALEHNLGVLTAEERVDHQAGTRRKSWASCCRTSTGACRKPGSRQPRGVRLRPFGDAFAGVPTIVGPFNVFDARVYVSQALLDLQRLNKAQSEAHNVEAARFTYARRARPGRVGRRQPVPAGAGRLRPRRVGAGAAADRAGALQAGARPEAERHHRRHRRAARRGAARPRRRKRATAAGNEFEKAKLQLARVIGLPLGQPFALDPMLPELPRSGHDARPGGRAARTRRAPTTRRRSSGSSAAEASRRPSSARRCRRCASTPTTAPSA